MIGANISPALVQESASPAPADYNGDGMADLASRVNSGPNKGRFQIDYFNTNTLWFQKQGWPFKTSAAIYGTERDFLVSADYDGDGKADIGVYFPETKIWRIDYAKNGFGKWDLSVSYSTLIEIDKSAIPVPAKYDNDNKADLSFKTNSGKWIFDFSKNGFGDIDEIKNGYGNSSEHPVPADYDHDGIADLSVKTDLGVWKIDYYANGYSGWDAQIPGCGDKTEIPVPADYNGDGKADLSVKTDRGIWKVAYTFKPGHPVSWLPETMRSVYGGADAAPFAADYNGDGKSDFSFAFTPDGRWWIDDFSANTNGYDWMSFPGKTADDHNINQLNKADIENYTKLKDCYFNVILDAMNFYNYDNQKDYYLALIDKVGINTMLTDAYIAGYNNPLDELSFNRKAFVNQYKNRLSPKIKKRIYAINLGDEPSDKNINPASLPALVPLESVRKWTEFFSREYAEVPTFNNLLPMYGFATTEAYIAYLNNYKAVSNSPIVCFDQYPFTSQYFISSYFFNLALIKKIFAGRALWSTVWSGVSSINDIQDPNEQQLQFMAFCPIAYGAKGIVYFPYDKFFNPRFISALNNDQKKYKYAKNINLFLKNIIAPVAIECTNIATLHKADTYQNKVFPFDDSELLGNYKGIVKDVNNKNILLGIFVKSKQNISAGILKGGNNFVWLVNKDTNAIKKIIVTLRGNYVNRIRISPRPLNYLNNPTNVFSSPAGVKYDSELNTTDFIVPELAGGEGIMIKLP